MKLNQKELNELVSKMTEGVLASAGVRDAVRKIGVGLGEKKLGEMSKQEKTIKFFQAQMDGDLSTIKALSGGVADGGQTLLPTEFMQDVIDRVTEDPLALRNLCTVVPVNTRTGWFPVGSTGVVLDWEGNDNAFTETAPKFDQLQYGVNRLAGFTAISRDLMADTPVNLYDYLTKQYAKAFTKAENKAILAGSGVGQPEGIRINTDIVSKPVKTTGQFVADDIVALPYAIDINYRAGSVYIMNSAAVKACRLMKDEQGRYYFVDGDITKGLPATFNGFKVVELTDGLPSNLGTGTDETEVIFGNLENYYIFDRNEMGSEINTQSDTAFKNHQALMKLWERLDGKVAIPKAFVKLTGVKTA